jgi:hypothetical protein
MIQVVILYIFRVQVEEDSGQYLKTAHQQTKEEEKQEAEEEEEAELEEAQEAVELLHVTFQQSHK